MKDPEIFDGTKVYNLLSEIKQLTNQQFDLIVRGVEQLDRAKNYDRMIESYQRQTDED